MRKTIIILLAAMAVVSSARAERIKDIADLHGVRSNPVMGVGLVVGLAGTGDKGEPSRQLMTNILRRSGMVFNVSDLTSGSLALVMVTADLGPFDRVGAAIDVAVSTLEDASTLQGGMLLATELRGLDGQVYAVASGPVSTSGIAVAGDMAAITKNHPTVAVIPGGAIVEKQELSNFVEEVAGQRFIAFNLRNKDFATAQNMASAINEVCAGCAAALDAGKVRVTIPTEITQRNVAGFVDFLSQLDVAVDMPAVVVINERTGTIVVGERVGISAVAIAQGSLVVRVKETDIVSQPLAPFSDAGTTEITRDTMIGVQEAAGHLIPVQRVVTVYDLARALNAIGASPRDMIAIFNMLKKAGALQARLEIM
ncbi:MAG TPA: flagellar basal body P-ring protein FlgI [Sedimentisphaerales bacterium]|nr:flagellar basal body P-ring protein FlgI [Sedimentisphaerales bacterium]